MSVRVAFDTSALLPLVLPGHPRYEVMKPWDAATREGRVSGVVVAHVIAELFATATAIPGVRIAPKSAAQAIEALLQAFEVVPGSANLYRAAAARCASVGAISGAVYDTLHIIAAESAGARAIVTLDPADFERFRVATSPPIVVPPADVGLLD